MAIYLEPDRFWETVEVSTEIHINLSGLKISSLDGTKYVARTRPTPVILCTETSRWNDHQNRSDVPFHLQAISWSFLAGVCRAVPGAWLPCSASWLTATLKWSCLQVFSQCDITRFHNSWGRVRTRDDLSEPWLYWTVTCLLKWSNPRNTRLLHILNQLLPCQGRTSAASSHKFGVWGQEYMQDYSLLASSFLVSCSETVEVVFPSVNLIDFKVIRLLGNAHLIIIFVKD